MNNNRVISYYNQFDEWGRLEREPLEFNVNWHYIRRFLPKNGHILDNGAGPGKYAMELASCGYEVTLTDLTPRLVQIAREKAQELALTERFKGFHIADARSLNIFSDDSFDASLMMGPLYHLQLQEEREQAVKELYRVTRRDGYVFVSFMTRIRHVLTVLAHPQSWRPNDNMGDIQAFMETGLFNHSDEGRFTGAYYYHIDDITPFMETHGFETIKLIGSSSAAGSLTKEQFDYWKSLGAEHYAKFMQFIYDTAENNYLLGSSSHLLYIGKRK
ncbi:SAM-dependent methyltransferase [Paenibacillus sp. FSL H8-0548]|uniref:class I SAM-dependent methyltransferase n=1 Tax=Paenibacillus sp. FSL H8-0548 TaxID=1920422 RepID=UPI00096D11BB|nr:class I SAM-dependent methyltransferase [Paenibacillus sp. FSL H8-0548]OMF22344.1 SAM-dependent methyltransferase [Paenibacillus sp. FSL H8-0548]